MLTLLLHARDAIVMRPHYAVAYARGYTTASDHNRAAMAGDLRISVIVCAHNEARYLPACLHSVLAQSRQPDELLVINNASTDETAAVAAEIPFVHVIDEPRKGLVVAREAGRRHASGGILIYLDADCRAPLTWIARIERRFHQNPELIALSG